MQGKKSINVTDILPYHSISKISHFSTVDTAFCQAKSITNQIEKKQSGHHFLSKIKGQIQSLKLKKQNRYDEQNNIQLDNNNSGQSEHQSQQKIDQDLHRIQNFSPFNSEQKLYKNIYHRQMENILEEKQRHRNCFIYKTLIEKKKFYKQKKILNHSNEGRKTAKVAELNAQFNKVKLFQKQLNLTTTLANLNPYQLSQKRKNLNLIKMRLGSLGYKADEDEKNQYNAIQKLMQEKQHKKCLHSNFKHKQLLKKLQQQSKKQAYIQKRTRSINEKDQLTKQTYYRVGHSEENKNFFQIASKTIQIHQIQRNGTKAKGQYLSRSNQKQKKINKREIIRIQ